MIKPCIRLIGIAALTCHFLASLPADAADRPAEQILADIDAIKPQQLDPKDRQNPDARKDFAARQRATLVKRAELIGELYRTAPDHPRLVKLMPLKWQISQTDETKLAASLAEVDAILAGPANNKLYAEAAYFKFFVLALGRAGPDAKFEQIYPGIEEFIRRVPTDPRGAKLLKMAAEGQPDENQKARLLDRIEKDYPETSTARSIIGERRQASGLGKPFKLEFKDAISGSNVSIEGLKGKVVVIDFWATWCGPCIEEMPEMKALYDRYKAKGVEFIGVSLDTPVDQGGLDKLKAYVAKNQITWPQYYMGDAWESEFSVSWGIQGIPCAFLVDAEGKLVSTKARGELEHLIPEYLEKAKAPTTAK